MTKREKSAKKFALISLLTLNTFAGSDKLLNFTSTTVSFRKFILKYLATIKAQLFIEKLLCFLLHLRMGNFSKD